MKKERAIKHFFEIDKISSVITTQQQIYDLHLVYCALLLYYFLDMQWASKRTHRKTEETIEHEKMLTKNNNYIQSIIQFGLCKYKYIITEHYFFSKLISEKNPTYNFTINFNKHNNYCAVSTKNLRAVIQFKY